MWYYEEHEIAKHTLVSLCSIITHSPLWETSPTLSCSSLHPFIHLTSLLFLSVRLILPFSQWGDWMLQSREGTVRQHRPGQNWTQIRARRPLLKPMATACYQQLNYSVSLTDMQAVFITPVFPPWQSCMLERLLLCNYVIFQDLGWNYNALQSWHSHEACARKEAHSWLAPGFAQRALSSSFWKEKKKPHVFLHRSPPLLSFSSLLSCEVYWGDFSDWLLTLSFGTFLCQKGYFSRNVLAVNHTLFQCSSHVPQITTATVGFSVCKWVHMRHLFFVCVCVCVFMHARRFMV